MATFEEFDALSSQELHDRAIGRARKHLDVKFFWRLLEEIPAAEAASGHEGVAEADAHHISAQLEDALNQSPDLKDALRPLYIDYLQQHDDA